MFFQCAVLTAEETPITLLTRRPDLLQARQTSTIEDIRLWWDAEDADPASALREILREKGLAGKRIAVEMNTHGLTGWNLHRIQVAMAGFCTLEFDRHMIRLLRLVKSPAEIEVMRQAGHLFDNSLAAVIAAARPGVIGFGADGDILSVVLGGGGDMPPNAPLFNSGARAVYGRGVSTSRAGWNRSTRSSSNIRLRCVATTSRPSGPSCSGRQRRRSGACMIPSARRWRG